MLESLSSTPNGSETHPSDLAVGSWNDPGLRARVDEFVFSVERWVDPKALAQYCQSKSGQTGPDLAVDFAQLSVVHQRRLISAHLPPKDIPLGELTRDWRARLALLPAADWMKLGFAVSVLPFCGHVQRSMDGNFRRALRETFGPAVWAELDSHPQASGELQFLLGPGAWKVPPSVAAGGVRCAIEQACEWPSVVRERVCLKFDPAVLEAPVSVRGLTPYWLEIACKITLQDHPWLWS